MYIYIQAKNIYMTILLILCPNDKYQSGNEEEEPEHEYTHAGRALKEKL